MKFITRIDSRLVIDNRYGKTCTKKMQFYWIIVNYGILSIKKFTYHTLSYWDSHLNELMP